MMSIAVDSHWPCLTRFWVAVLLFSFLLLTSARAETTYIVRKNDTLESIARQHGVTMAALLQANPSIKQPNQIRAGQKLRMPIKKAAAKPTLSDPALLRQLNQIAVEPRRWKHVVIHHSATDSGTAKGLDRYHREVRHMENGLAYHFLIGNGRGMRDGEVNVGGRWIEQIKGGHLASDGLNETSIGICLVGNFDEGRPSKKQLAVLRELVIYLLDRCQLGLDAVKTHQEINTVFTRCPGKKFPGKTLMADLRKQLPRGAQGVAMRR